MDLKEKDISRALIIDAQTRAQVEGKRDVIQQRYSEIEAEYRLSAAAKPEDNEAPATYDGSRVALSNQHRLLLERIKANFGKTAADNAQKHLSRPLHSSPVYEYILNRIHADSENRFDFLKDASTEAVYYDYFALVDRTWRRLRDNKVKPQAETLWKVAVGLKLTAKEADSLFHLAQSKRSEFDRAMALCARLAETEPDFYKAENVNNLLACWFGDEEDTHQLYTDKFPVIPAKKQNS